MITPKELEEAVTSYKNGEQKAFSIVYELSQKYIYVCIRNVMYKQDSVDDIIADMMQETYLEISKSVGQLVDEKDFLSWASTIANRKCFAYLKRNNKLVLLPDEDKTFDTLADNENIIPESIMQDKEKQRLIKKIIDNELTEMQRLCVVGYYYNESKQSTIAEELGIPESTVKTNLSRAKAKIKEGVLKLEKNEGTKLYSVAPFMLLIFKEEVQACLVPKTIGATIGSSLLGNMGVGSAGATIAKSAGLVSKIASISVKVKIMVAVISVVAVTGGTVKLISIAQQSKDKVVKVEYGIEDAIEETDEFGEVIETPVEKEITLPQEQMATLEYLLGLALSCESVEPNTIVQPLITNQGKITFMVSILIDNYWAKNNEFGYETECIPVINESATTVVEAGMGIQRDMSIDEWVVYEYDKDVINTLLNNFLGSSIQTPESEFQQTDFIQYQDEKYILNNYTDFSVGALNCFSEFTNIKITQRSEEEVIIEFTTVKKPGYEPDVTYDFTVYAKVNTESPCGYTLEKYSYSLPEAVEITNNTSNSTDLLQQIYNIDVSYLEKEVEIIEDDYDDDGINEYFFVFTEKGTSKEDYYNYYAEIWFGNGKGVSRVLEWENIVPDTFGTLTLGENKFFRYDMICPSDSYTSLLDVVNNECVTSFGLPGDGYFDNTNDFYVVVSGYGSNDAKDGNTIWSRTRISYFFYLGEDGFHEYGATVISLEEFLQYGGATEILEEAKAKYGNDGGEVTFEFLKRTNGVINVNIIVETSFDFTYYYETYQIDENSTLTMLYYGVGRCLTALKEEMAVY